MSPQIVQHTGDSELPKCMRCCSDSQEDSIIAPSVGSGLLVPEAGEYSPCRLVIVSPAFRQSSSLSHSNATFAASASLHPWAKPNCVKMARAAVVPKFSIRYLRCMPIATASSSSARCPAKRSVGPTESNSNRLLWLRSSIRMRTETFGSRQIHPTLSMGGCTFGLGKHRARTVIVSASRKRTNVEEIPSAPDC